MKNKLGTIMFPQYMTIGGQYIEWDSTIVKEGIRDTDWKIEDIPTEVEVLYWGHKMFVEETTQLPFSQTIVYCRIRKSGIVIEVNPTQLILEKDI